MNWLELAATLLTLACVLLAVKRNILTYPVGIVGTALFFVVFWQTKLYSSAWLQVVFIAAQAYGWWFWLYGAKGAAPRVGSWPWPAVAALCLGALALAWAMARIIAASTDANMALPDAAIFALSVAAQFLLDRKKIETWTIWGIVNALSVWVYASQQLWATTALYAFLFLNAFWGWHEWRKDMKAAAA
jgi:nicotinamide mononucleotide transporter